MMRLALVFLKIGLASYGGGWTIVGLIRTEIVGRGWLDAAAFADLVAIAQVTPGPVALNAATMVGFRLYGLVGAAVATLAVVAAPVGLSLALGALARKALAGGGRVAEALKTATLGLLAMTLWAFAPSAAATWTTAALSLLAFAVSLFTRLNPLWLILGSGALGAVARLVF